MPGGTSAGLLPSRTTSITGAHCMLSAASLFLIPLFLAPPQAEDSALVRQDVQFARGLAANYGYTDLAELVINQAMATSSLSESDLGLLLLTRCEIRKASARRIQKAADRLEALRLATDAYDEFLTQRADSPYARQAKVDIADIAYQYGETLSELFVASSPGEDEKQELLDSATAVFQPSLRGLNAMVGELEGKSESERSDTETVLLYQSMFYRAQIYYYWGKLYPANSLERDDNVRRATQHLEDMALVVGEASRAGLLAYILMAKCYALAGDAEFSEEFFSHVATTAAPWSTIAEAEEAGVGSAEVDARRGIVQHAYAGMLEMFREFEDSESALRYASDFEAFLSDNNVLPNSSGYQALIESALLRANTGDIGGALELAQRVLRENKGNINQLRAEQAIARILESAPSLAAIPLEALYQAAEGTYFSKDYDQAIEGFRRVLARLEGDRKAEEFGGKAYYYLGQCWMKKERWLEGAACFETGFELFSEDEEYLERSAKAWFRLAELLAQKSSDDRVLLAYRDRAQQALMSVQSNAPDALLWNTAERDYKRAKEMRSAARGHEAGSKPVRDAIDAFIRASRSYGEIEKRSSYYEKAIVQQGMCAVYRSAWESGAADEAIRLFDSYLDEYVQNPDNVPRDARERKRRVEATAQADFYRRQVVYTFAKEAVGDAAEESWRRMLALAQGYETRHPDQAGYVAESLRCQVEAHLALGDVTSAISVFEQMQANQVSAKRIGLAALIISGDFGAASEAAKDESDRLAALRSQADYLSIYNRNSTPSSPSLIIEGRLRLEIGEAATAAKLLGEVLARFGDELGSRTFGLEVDYCRALLLQDKTGEVLPILERLYAEKENNRDVLDLYSRALGGWAEMREGRPVEIPGPGDAASFELASSITQRLIRLTEQNAAGGNKWVDCAWWRYKFQAIYITYRWGQVDSTHADRHRGLIDQLSNLSQGDLGESACGESLKSMFQWLKIQ